MKLRGIERDQLTETGEVQPSGNGWRHRLAERRGGRSALRLVMVAILAAAGAWALYANLRPDRPAMDMNMRITSGATPFPVVMVPVERGSMTGTVTYTGSVAPFNEEDVYPRVTGRIVEMPVYPGDAVRAGQVVARLDSVELTSRVGEAEAALAAAQASRAQMEADLAVAQHGVVQMQKELAMVDAELGYARSVIARTERLFNTGAVSRQEYESDRAMAAAAEAKRDAAQHKLEQAQAAETAARKKLDTSDSMASQARASLRTTSIIRDYVTIVAPNPGYVVKRLVAPGVLVQPGMAILKIAQIDRVRLQANVGEKDLGSIRVGSPVQVTTTAAAEPPLVAAVTAVFPFVDQGGRTAVVEALVDNAGRRLLPGQYVTMRFVTGQREQALIAPASAVIRMGGKATLWAVKDGRAEPRPVVTGLQGEDRVEIVEGLTGGERIIASGQEGLYAGARVTEVAAAPLPASQPAEPAQEMPDMPGMNHSTHAPTQHKEGAHAGH
jgi:HlyD family secretion protein